MASDGSVRTNIALSHLLIDSRWEDIVCWEHINWRPISENKGQLNTFYGEVDTSSALDTLKQAANTIWTIISVYPAQLFFQMAMCLVNKQTSAFLVDYYSQILEIINMTSMAPITPMPMKWDAPAGMLTEIVDVSCYTEDVLTAICVVPNTKHVVCGTMSGEMFTIDIRTQERVGTLHGHSNQVWAIAVSKDGSFIVSGSVDNTVRLWNANTHCPIGEPFRGHTNIVRRVAISDNMKYIASGSYDSTVRLWDIQNLCPIGEPLKGHLGAVYSVAFSPDSERIVSGSFDRSIRIWSVQSGKIIGKPLLGHHGRVRCVSVSPDGENIISCSDDRTIRVWDIKSGHECKEPVKFGDWVREFSLDTDTNTILSICRDGTATAWNLKTRNMFFNFNVEEYYRSKKASVSFDQKYIVFSQSRKLLVYSMERRCAMVHPLQFANPKTVKCAVSSGGNVFGLSFGNHKSIFLWDIIQSTATSIGRPFQAKYKFNGFALSRCGSLVFVCDGNWLEAWAIQSKMESFGLLNSKQTIASNHSTFHRRGRYSRNCWKCIATARVKGGKGMINSVKLDEIGGITVIRSDDKMKEFKLKRKMRSKKWQFVNIGEWKILSVTSPTWLVSFRDYTVGKTREEINGIPSWLMDCSENHVYDVARKRILATFSSRILQHCWLDESETRKKLFIVLDDGKVFILDVVILNSQ